MSEPLTSPVTPAGQGSGKLPDAPHTAMSPSERAERFAQIEKAIADIAEGKPVEEFEGQLYVRETWLRADLAIVKAWKADTAGNLVYRRTARNFNPNMATAGKVTVAEVEEIVPVGSLDPEAIHTPGIYVDRLIKSTINEKKIEKLTERKREAA